MFVHTNVWSCNQFRVDCVVRALIVGTRADFCMHLRAQLFMHANVGWYTWLRIHCVARALVFGTRVGSYLHLREQLSCIWLVEPSLL